MILCFATLCSDVVLAKVFVYPMADGIKKSSLFEIEVSDGGEFLESPVYTNVAQWKTNRCKTTSWTSFATDTKPVVRVKTNAYKVEVCRILPRKYNIACHILNDSTVEFKLPGPGQYSVEFEEGVAIAHPLLIFVDTYPLKKPAEHTPNLIVFEKGYTR